MERKLCLVCGCEYDTGAILLDRRLRQHLERYTTTGWGLCEEHQRLHHDGYVALVECDPRRSGEPSSKNLLPPDQAYRTGRLAHLRREAFARMFDVPITPHQPCIFVDPGVIDQLQLMAQH